MLHLCSLIEQATNFSNDLFAYCFIKLEILKCLISFKNTNFYLGQFGLRQSPLVCQFSIQVIRSSEWIRSKNVTVIILSNFQILTMHLGGHNQMIEGSWSRIIRDANRISLNSLLLNILIRIGIKPRFMSFNDWLSRRPISSGICTFDAQQVFANWCECSADWF